MGALTHNGEVLQSLPADASQINFDNTGTNLNSTQTENAIKEVNTKVNTNTEDITQLKSGLNGLIVAEDRQLSFVNGKCEVSIPSDYILIAAIAGATLDFVAGFTLISGPTVYALFLKDTATLDRSVRLVYASKYIVLST